MPHSNFPENLTIRRYPETSNKSLRAWNAGDEYILAQLAEMDLNDKSISVYNDRFGYLSCHLAGFKPHCVVHRKSQETSIMMNAQLNNLNIDKAQFSTPFNSETISIDIGLMQIPKSLDLFRYFLHKLSESLSDDGIALCAFMTKYFTPGLLEIAGDYFENVEQSLAKKKSRILILEKKKPLPKSSFVESYEYSFDEKHTETLKQFPGVFSSGQVDYATQFLLESFTPTPDELQIADVGSGNGVISRAMQILNPETTLHLIDDSILAIESSKLNMRNENVHFHWKDTLEDLEGQPIDLALSNPPFHFGHETNIEISVNLFREIAGLLKPGGRFVCVANNHLGYLSHLKKFFRSVDVLARNEKFVIYESRK